jgi:hypothetical protein
MSVSLPVMGAEVPFPQIDHLVYAVPDLPAAVAALHARLGVEPAFGGQHPAWGTRNALVSLGPRTYLELMGPDPALPPPAGARPFGIDGLASPRLASWACRGEDLTGIAEEALRLGVSLGDVQARSRKRPDGTLLAWTMTDLQTDREGGVVPFFLDWGATPHPAAAAPGGCALLELRATHPEPDRIREILRRLGVGIPVSAGPRASLAARISTPRGVIELD